MATGSIQHLRVSRLIRQTARGNAQDPDDISHIVTRDDYKQRGEVSQVTQD